MALVHKDIELVIFKEVECVLIAGKTFPAEMRRDHSVIEGWTDGKGVFVINNKKVTAKDIIEAGLTPRLVLWESGGGHSNTGFAQVVCGLKGQKLIPIYIRRRGSLACSRHAKFVAWPGQVLVVVDVSHHRGDFDITVFEEGIRKPEKEHGEFYSHRVLLWHCEGIRKNEIEDQIPTKLDRYLDAVKAAMNKATCYHCREPHYILDEES